MMILAIYLKELLKRWGGLRKEPWAQQKKRFVSFVCLSLETVHHCLDLLSINIEVFVDSCLSNSCFLLL